MRGEPGRVEGGGGRDGRVGGGLRGGVGDSVRNQRREEHLRRKQNRMLNIVSNTRGGKLFFLPLIDPQVSLPRKNSDQEQLPNS